MLYKPVIITSYGMLGTVASTDMSKTKAGWSWWSLQCSWSRVIKERVKGNEVERFSGGGKVQIT